MAWAYRRVAGIDTDAAGPGFHHLTIQPHFRSKRSLRLHVEYDSGIRKLSSPIGSQSQHRFTISIPANTTATVILPLNRTETIGSGAHTYTIQKRLRPCSPSFPCRSILSLQLATWEILFNVTNTPHFRKSRQQCIECGVRFVRKYPQSATASAKITSTSPISRPVR